MLATSIAETSLTVPGVGVVIDGGWRRAPRLDAATGLSRLTTLRISRAAAEQRAGRAGREVPGLAIRLWSEALHRGLAAFDRPEILEADLSSLLLDCLAWGAAPSALPFLDPPPSGALAAAESLLMELGALEGAGRISAFGRRMAMLGAHPQLAAMMLAATGAGEAALGAEIAALLEARSASRRRCACGHHFAAGRSGGRRSRCARSDPARCRAVSTAFGIASGVNAEGSPGRLLAAAFPDRIAQRRSQMDPSGFRQVGERGCPPMILLQNRTCWPSPGLS